MKVDKTVTYELLGHKVSMDSGRAYIGIVGASLNVTHLRAMADSLEELERDHEED